MSCNILVDIENFPSNNQNTANRSSPNKRDESFGQRFSISLSLVSRILYFRRFKLLKIYMATIVLIGLLLLIFKHQTAISYGAIESNGRLGLQESIIQTDSNFLQDTVQTIPRQNDGYIPKTESNSMLNGVSVYPNNLTHLLTGRDFLQMKNINLMQVRIREAMKHSWDNYRRYAWGYDMLKPKSREADHWFNLGLTIVDSADTLIMMGLTHDTNLAIDWIENELKFTTNSENSNCFELTIRILAGILSTYHLTGREKLKLQAMEFGNILLHCYDTESRVVPFSDIDLNTHRGHPPQWNPHSSLSEVSSLQVEFRYLSQISGDPIFERTTFRTSQHLHNLTMARQRKLLPMYINPNNGQLEEGLTTLGARTDSYYEYLLKQHLQTGIKWLETDYLDAIDEIETYLFKSTGGSKNYTYIAEMQVYRTSNDTEDLKYFNKMDHLVCFLPGTLALGYYHFSPLAAEYRLKYNLETPVHKLNSRYDSHLSKAMALARTCYHMYSDMGTGLSPEIATFVQQTDNNLAPHNVSEIQAQSSSAHNILRPEYVESLFYLYHITGLPVYREEATRIFDSFQEYSRIPSGYCPISDVRSKPASSSQIHEMLHRHAPDRMESFWLSETLKYLYLIFCDDRRLVGTILNHYVFNTEGHLMPIL